MICRTTTRAADHAHTRLRRATFGVLPLAALTLTLAGGCGDDGGAGGTPDPDGGTMMMSDGALPPDDGGTDPTDGGDPGDPDAYVPPGCESVTCTHGACVIEGGAPVCRCDAGWRGEACAENDAPDPRETVLWLDATESSSLLVGSAGVSAWSDLSGSGADFTQADTDARPAMGTIGGLPAVEFDGTNDALTSGGFEGFTGQARYTYFVVVAASSDDAILAGYGGGKARLALLDSDGEAGLWALHAGGVAAELNGSVFSGEQLYERNRVHLVTVQRTPVAMSLWIDGRFRKVVPNTGPENIVGALDLVLGDDTSEATSSPLEGRIGEIIAYDSALDIAQRRRVEAYLSAKWLGGAVTHDESSFGNIEVWLDASDTASLGMVGDGTVDTWDNLAGSQDFVAPYPYTNPTYVADGLNDMGVLRFDGEDDMMRNAFAQSFVAGPEYTIVAVAASRAPTSDQPSWLVAGSAEGYSIPGAGLAIRDLGARATMRHKSPADVAGFGDTVEATGGTAEAPVVLIGTWDDGEMRLEAGFGTETMTPTQPASGNLLFTVGAHSNTASSVDNYAGDIAELLIFRHALSLAERTELRELLSAKWGID